MTKDEWKARSCPLLTRIVALEQKAEDDGLTGSEREELARMKAVWKDKYIKMLVYEVDVES